MARHGLQLVLLLTTWSAFGCGNHTVINRRDDCGARCDDPCGDPPGGVDCIDACGNFSSPACYDGAWTCPVSDDLTCDDPPPHGGALWSDAMGGDTYERVTDVAIDDDGNVWLVGAFQDVLVFDDTALSSSGGYDMFVAKYDATGVRQWLQQYGGTGDDLSISVGVDALGFAVVTFTEATVAAQPAASGKLRMMKLDPSGAASWQVDFDFVQGTSFGADTLAVDANGTIMLAGYATAGNVVGASALASDGVFVARFDAAGAHVWTREIAATGYHHLGGIASDDLGNVFVTGTSKDTMTVDGAILTSSGGFDGYVIALDALGDHRWSHTFGSTTDDELGARVAAAGDGGAALTGAFGAGILIAGSSVFGSGARSALVARFDDNGELDWTRVLSGASETLSGHDRWLLAMDDGDVVVAGHFEGQSNVAEPSASAGNYDMLLTRFDPNGNTKWGWSFGDENTELAAAVATGPNQTVALVGEYWGGPDLGNGQLVSHADGSMFVALFDDDGAQ